MRLVEPCVPRHRPLDGPQTPHDVAQEPQRRPEMKGLAADQRLVGKPTGAVDDRVQPVALGDLEPRLGEEPGERLRPLDRHGRRPLAQPHEL